MLRLWRAGEAEPVSDFVNEKGMQEYRLGCGGLVVTTSEGFGDGSASGLLCLVDLWGFNSIGKGFVDVIPKGMVL